MTEIVTGTVGTVRYYGRTYKAWVLAVHESQVSVQFRTAKDRKNGTMTVKRVPIVTDGREVCYGHFAPEA